MRGRSKGIILSYLNTALHMVCGLFLSSFLLRMLGDTDYGVYQTVASFANSLVILQFGTGTVMTRNVTMCRAGGEKPEEIKSQITSILFLTMQLSLLIAGFSCLFYFQIETIYAKTLSLGQLVQAKKIFVLVAANLIVSFCAQTVNGIILAFEHYGFGALQSIFQTVLRTVGQTALIWRYRQAILIAHVDLTVSVILLLWSLVYVFCQFHILPWSGRIKWRIIHSSAPMCLAVFLQTITNQANNNVDKFLIGIKMSPESVSLYAVAMYVYGIFSSITTIPITMYAPAVLKAVETDMPMAKLEQSLTEPCRLTSIIGGMIYFGFFAAGEQFIELVYGQSYISAWLPAVLIMTPMYLNMVNGVLINILDAKNKRMVRSMVLLGTTLCNILLTIFWLDKWGIVGAAMATMVCTFAGQVLIMNLYYSKKMGIRILHLFRKAFQGVLIWLILGCVAARTMGAMVTEPFISFLVRGAVFLMVFILGYLFLGMSQEEKQMLMKLRRGRKT